MEVKAKDEEQRRPVSVLQGDGFCINRILARESSVGQSSHIFYRAAEGVPFKWEMRPGRPKTPQEEDAIPPLCPSPLMQSLGLPLPNLDHDEPKESASKTSRLRKMVKKCMDSDLIKKVEILLGIGKKQKEIFWFEGSNGEFVVKDSSFSSTSSSSSSLSPHSRVMDTSMIDGPFCCSSANVPAVLEEGNTTIYYCSKHKAAFAVEEDGSFLSRILSKVSTGEQFSGPLHPEFSPAGIPFEWEMQPGTPKNPPENELIPPPSPPPAMQSLSLPQPRLHTGSDKARKSTWKKAWFWKRQKNETGKMQHEISFRFNENMENCSSDLEFDASFRELGSVSSLSSIASLTKGNWRVSKIRSNFQGGYLSCGPWRKKKMFLLEEN